MYVYIQGSGNVLKLCVNHNVGIQCHRFRCCDLS